MIEDKLSEEEKALVKEYRKYCKDNHLRCSNSCALWDSIDKDCDVYGTYRPARLSNCSIAFSMWLENKQLAEMGKEKKK